MIGYKELMKLVDFYYELKMPYKIERSGQSIYLYQAGVAHYSSVIDISKKAGRLPVNEIGFIRRVKHDIIKKGLHEEIGPNYKNRESIKFFDFNRSIPINSTFKSPYSVDIKGAYWDSANKDGWLTPEIYAEGLRLDKKIRLASLGTFAKKIMIWEFDGVEEKMKKSIEPTHPHVFFNQANSIYKLMEKCKKAVGNDYLFYWTDGIYVKTKAAAEICEEVLANASFRSETQKLINAKRNHEGFITNEWRIQNGVKIKTSKPYKANIV